MREVCKTTILRIIGQEYGETDLDTLTETRKYYTDMVSTQQVLQYFQMINTGKFAPLNYDYEEKNKQKYGVSPPNDYDLAKVKVPLTIFYGSADALVSPKVR